MASNRYISSINKICEYLESCDKKGLSMIIGYRVTNPADTKRNLKFDIALDHYDTDELKYFFESSTSTSITQLVFNIDFNFFCVLSKQRCLRYSNANKISSIVFDSSTFKFLSNIKTIALFYYLFLEQYGSIYIESSNPMCVGCLIENQTELLSLIQPNKNGFYYQYGYILPINLEHLLDNDKKEVINDFIITHDEIYTKNVEFFKKWFYGSNVELLEDSYPIINEKYPIIKYYKITKKFTHEDILNHVSNNAKEFDEGLSLQTNIVVRMNTEKIE